MNNQLAAIAENVAHSLDKGWERAHKIARQPSKRQLMNCLYEEVLNGIARLIETSKQSDRGQEQ
jgi:hypothetical protein